MNETRLPRARPWRRPLTGLALAGLALGGLVPAARGGSRPVADPPDETRFSREVLAQGLDEPMQLEFDGRGGIYVIERRGALKRLDGASGRVELLGTLPVFTEGEGGLLGILLDRAFGTTRWLYLYYTAPGPEREARLSRFTLGDDGRLDPASEVVLLRWPHDVAAHMGGGMTWDRDGNLYLAVGENSVPTQYTPIHWTEPGGRREDSQRTAANTDDLRGKILRIRPERDGTYSVPAGNLFPPGTPDARPEIFTMGNRNPWRLSVDSRTGHLHWGEIGPDAGRDSAGIGPRGYDEFNVARAAGNYGWPYFIGYNRAYHRFDPATGTYGPPFDPERPVNRSPNNTGLRELPPARPALIAYPYGVSEEFPILSSGGRAAVGGPVFRRTDFADAERPFPDYYEGKWFVTDFVRAWIMVVTLDPEREEVVSLERFLPRERYRSPMDLEFGPTGDLYLLEYGRAPEGRLSRITYHAGNRAPRVRVGADRTAGAVPLRVALSSAGTVDHDGDPLRFRWVVTGEDGEEQRFAGPAPTVTLRRPGTYRAVLTVTDPSGAEASAALELVAGNEPPRVALEIVEGNRSFYFLGDTVGYRVVVSDREDGSLAGGGIPPDEVQVTVEYVPGGLTPAEAAEAADLDPEASVRHARALRIMAGSDCAACHQVETRAVGPAFREIGRRYAEREGAVAYLAGKIVAGGSGVWGEVPMPPHPALAPAEAATLAQYVLGLAEADAGPRRVSPRGRLATPGRLVQRGRDSVPEPGAYVLRAKYTDRGAGGVAPITTGDLALLRHPRVAPETADTISAGFSRSSPGGDPSFIVDRDGAYIGFRDIDLTGVARIEVRALTRFWTWSHFVGGTVEVRLGAPAGRRVGEPARVTPPAAAPRAPTEPARGAPQGEVFLGERLEPPVHVDVSGVDGVHDVYLVFRNPGAGESDALMLVTAVEFQRPPPGGRARGGIPAAGRGGLPEGFTPIFNGRDLAGWHPSRTTHHGATPDASVEDGVLVLRQRPYGQGGVLLTDRRYRDFELYLEARPDWGTNGGILFRSSESGSAYQVELAGGNGATGSLFGEMLRVARGARADDLDRVWRDDDWNSFRLRVVGDVPRMTLWVNGERMWDVQAERNDLIAGATDGMIGLQVHWSATYDPAVGFDMSGSWKPGAAQRFRNLGIREIE